MLVIPFRVTVPEAKQDKHLPERLKAELAGIFNWSIVRLRRLLKAEQFTRSTVSQAALEAFRAEDDPMREFCLTHIAPQTDSVTPKCDVYDRYVSWCGSQGEVAVHQRAFGKAIRKVLPGIEDTTTTRDRRTVEAYKGVCLAQLH
jgi:putative DNA primase/helicase